MKSVYTNNPELGNANKLKSEIEKYENELKELTFELKQLQVSFSSFHFKS